MKRLFLVVVIAVVGQNALGNGASVLRCTSSGSVITLATSRLDWDFPTTRQGNRNIVHPALRATKGVSRSLRIGSPDLPVLTTLIALPNGNAPRIEILDQPSFLKTVDDVARVDTMRRAAPVGEGPGGGTWSPQSIVELGPVGVLRGVHVVSVRVHPAQYNASTHQLRLLTSVRIALHLSGGVSTTAVGRKESAAWETMAASLIANSLDAARWRRTPLAAPGGAKALSASAIRVKMFVHHDGMYRVLGRDLDSLGVRSSIDPRTLHVYSYHPDTVELPIRLTGAEDGRFDEDDSLEFVGTMHYGEEGDYFDDYTDENTYWLVWDDPAPQLLYQPTRHTFSMPPQPGYLKQDHMERDVEYYQGDHLGDSDNYTLYITEKVSGERYYWSFLDPGSNPLFLHHFVLGGIPDDGATATMRVHLRGISNAPPYPDHDIAIELNHQQVAEVQFQGWSDTVLTITFPCKTFYAGDNLLAIRSKPVASIVDQVAVDFIEITTPRETVFAGDSMYLTSRAGASMTRLLHARSPDVTVYSPTRHTQLLPTTVAGGTFVRVESRGGEDGRFVRLEVEDSAYGSSEYLRGVNVWIIDPATGTVRGTERFDTYASADEARRMTAYLAAVRKGDFVVAATCDEPANNFSDSARAGWRALGSRLIDRVAPFDSWAFVCRAGDTTFIPVETYTQRRGGGAHLTAHLPTTAVHSWAVTFGDSVDSNVPVVAQLSRSFETPRFERRQSTSWGDPSHRADYIVITHRALMPEARRLAAFHAQHDRFDTAVIDVEDLYDEFNGGVEREVPIRDFLRRAYTSWIAPAPSYVVLFGDATWDPKFNTPGAWRRDHVPTHGKPVSDYWYTLLDGDDLLPEMMLGRVSAPTIDTAHAVVDKIIGYESEGPRRWEKEFMFVTGGGSESEASIFQLWTGNNAFRLQQPPIGAHVTRIMRDKFDDPLQVDKQREITDHINSGVSWLTYFGHAAANLFEVTFDSANVLRNAPRLPFFSAFSCQTGAFAEPRIISADEIYFTEPANGYIGAWGISGFGNVIVDATLMDQAYSMLIDSGARELGTITTGAKIKLWTELAGGVWVVDVNNTMLQYELTGDPATRLALRTLPEVEIVDSDLRVVPAGGPGAVISDDDTAYVLVIALHNNGLTSLDTVEVGVHVAFNGGAIDTMLRREMPLRVDTITLSIPIRRISGEHVITVTADPNLKLLDEEDRSNNVARVSAIVYSSVLTTLRPVDNGSLSSACRANTIAVLAPQVGGQLLNYFFEVDTASSFGIPIAMSGALSAPVGPVLEWTIPAVLDTGRVYLWRARTRDGAGTFSDWIRGSFTANGPQWEQRTAGQFSADQADRVRIDEKGVHMGSTLLPIYVESRGFFVDPPGVKLQLGDQQPYANSNRGIFVFEMSDSTLGLDRARVYDTFVALDDSLRSKMLAAFIDSIPVNRIVVVAVGDEGANGLSQAGRDALARLGAGLSDSLAFRDSYVLIGRKGSPPGSAHEVLRRAADSAKAFLRDTVHYEFLSGRISSALIGPAERWESAEAALTAPSGTLAHATLYGRRNASTAWDSLADLSPNDRTANLATIDPNKYRYLQLVAQFRRTDITVEPLLTRWSVRSVTPPELLIHSPSLRISADTVLEGERPTLDAEIYNAGCTVARRARILVRLQSAVGTVTADSAQFDSIPASSSVHWKASLATAGARGPQAVLVTVDPPDSIPEIVETNNTLVGTLFVRKDTTAPSVTVTVDGRQILNGDITGPNPEIVVRELDGSPLPIQDPQCIIVHVDSVEYSSASNSDRFKLDFAPQGGGKVLATLHPFTLDTGWHELRVTATDATGNSDSRYIRNFRVNGTTSLEHVMNAPNPFADKTYFTFVLGGEQPPTGALVKIYSVAGRLLRALEIPASALRIGFNEVPWDGTDQDGDHLANGVYLYKLIVRLQDGDRSETQRIAIVR